MSFWKWSKTAATNATADPSINWSEGMPPAGVNDSGRAMMAAASKWRDDISGAITTAGTSTAYTISSNQVFDTLAHLNNAMIAFVPHTTNGATVTLNVDALGAKPLRYGPSLELQSGVLIQGTPYIASYNNADGAFYLQGGFANPYGVPLGGMIPYTGSTAPNSAFVIPLGQAISRTTFATYFSLVGTTYGVGDGSTTFNVLDMQNRTVFGIATTTPRITVAGGNFDGTVLGGTGGGQNQTLTNAQLPTVIGTSTNVTNGAGVGNGQSNTTVVQGSGGSVGVTGSASAYVNLSIPALQNSSGGNAHTIMPPAIILPYILRII